MIGSILIANRGEIACRVIRTCRRLGIRSIAVHSDADATAPHVRLADQACRIGRAAAAESYLRIDALLEAALASGAEAIHPGYGFLAENAAFAEAVAAAGLVFIGPPAAAIRAMGGKSEAKALMHAAGVPVVPGYHGAEQAPERLLAEAERIGWPVLIKASAGGGGKGMKVAADAFGFLDEVASARREAKAAFGDDRLLLERYLARPRHVEIQLLADAHGEVLHLLDRDCSIQRRHQKVLEEAPAPGLPDGLRAAMADAAVKAARAIGYRNAGTVEMLLDDAGRFYFMEMNTRLQVEHPVTEAVTGLDLVEWQIRIASGEPLPLTQEDIRARGHAVEVRLYAEDPAKGFLPQTGRLGHLAWPEGEGVRIDAGVAAGDRITVHYDPMLAKLIAWGADRPEAIRRLGTALDRVRILGLVTNRAFLQRLVAHPAFAAAELDTGFIARHEAALLPPAEPPSDRVLALAALGLLLDRRAALLAAAVADPWSPWVQVGGWRLNHAHEEEIRLEQPGLAWTVLARHLAPDRFRLTLPSGAVIAAEGRLEPDGRLRARLDALSLDAVWQGDEAAIWLDAEGVAHRLALPAPVAAAAAAEASGRLTAPMPGKVTALLVAPGDLVAAGQKLLVLEAMKMEQVLKAPAAGRVAAILVRAGDLVEEGLELVRLADPAADAP